LQGTTEAASPRRQQLLKRDQSLLAAQFAQFTF